jgi:uncharacterized membrane protein
MSGSRLTLERTLEGALTLGLLASSALLLAGLVRADPALLRAGTLVLMATPVVRVVLVTLGLWRRGDVLFAGLSAFVLAVLALSAFLAARP